MVSAKIRDRGGPAKSCATHNNSNHHIMKSFSVLHHSILALLIAAAGAAPARCAEKKLPTISVAKTDNKGIPYWQPAMGDGLAQMLITELNKLDNMKVL